MATLTTRQQELLDAAEARKTSGVFVQGNTYRTAMALVKKEAGIVRPLTDTTGWFISMDHADEASKRITAARLAKVSK